MTSLIDPVKVKHIFDNEDKKTSTIVMEGGSKYMLPINEANDLAKVVAEKRKMIDQFERNNPGLKI